MTPARLCCLGGLDSSGRAGIDADREVAAELGLVPRCVVTAWTEQDEGGVRALRTRASELWVTEARAALEAGALALKLGLLGGREAVRAVGEVVDAYLAAGRPVVVDPVLGASTGEAFVEPEALADWRRELLARPVVLTPNLPEATRLADAAPGEGLEARCALAETLLAAGVAAVVLKGGHGDEDPVHDLVQARDSEPLWHTHERLPGASLRGSGCRHATALAAGLARGLSLADAAALAGRLLRDRLVEAARGGH